MHTGTYAIQDRSTGLGISLAPSRGFFSADLASLLKDRQRNCDINGKEAGAATRLVGWRYADIPFLSIARRVPGGRGVAAGWAAPIRWDDEERLGVNIAYATVESFAGKGLSQLCVAISFLRLCEDTPSHSLGEVNIQCHVENEAAIRVAEKMGFIYNPAANFVVTSTARLYAGFKTSATALEAYSKQVLADRSDKGAWAPVNQLLAEAA